MNIFTLCNIYRVQSGIDFDFGWMFASFCQLSTWFGGNRFSRLHCWKFQGWQLPYSPTLMATLRDTHTQHRAVYDVPPSYCFYISSQTKSNCFQHYALLTQSLIIAAYPSSFAGIGVQTGYGCAPSPVKTTRSCGCSMWLTIEDDGSASHRLQSLKIQTQWQLRISPSSKNESSW